jgi:tRNA(Arg) A34 adenosine deaminase TadA
MRDAEHWMRLAIGKAREGVAAGQTPFGACVVRGDEAVALAHNVVLRTTDITAHAEVTAVREACRALGTIDLRGCVIYSTCEPCPMCFSACHWANLDRIVYGAAIADAAACGFRELSVSNEQMKRLGGSRVELAPGVLREEAVELFREWTRRPDRRAY